MFVFLGARGSVAGWGINATSRKVVGSIPDEIIGFLNWPNPSSRIMTVGSTQPLNRKEYHDSSWS
jgi:hypothetical protein